MGSPVALVTVVRVTQKSASLSESQFRSTQASMLPEGQTQAYGYITLPAAHNATKETIISEVPGALNLYLLLFCMDSAYILHISAFAAANSRHSINLQPSS